MATGIRVLLGDGIPRRLLEGEERFLEGGREMSAQKRIAQRDKCLKRMQEAKTPNELYNWGKAYRKALKKIAWERGELRKSYEMSRV